MIIEDIDEIEIEVHDITNEHGFLQTVDSEKSPVCSQCHSSVMPNRGQGTICDSCDHEFSMHCMHDY